MKNQASPSIDTQSGSILTMILIGVALFAALSYAMSQGTRTGGATISKEKTQLAAQEILEYSNAVKNGVKTLLINGCKETELNFDNYFDVGAYTNATAPTDKRCNIFDAAGAGLNWVAPPINSRSELYSATPASSAEQYDRYYFSGSNTIDSLATNAGELLIILAVNKATCVRLNEILSVTPSDPPSIETVGAHYGNAAKFKGSYSGTASFSGYPNTPAACEYEQVKGVYLFRLALIAR